MYSKPSWGRLYALATLMLALFGVVDVDVPAGVWRRALEVVIAVVAFGAIHVWIRANRRALDLTGERNAGLDHGVQMTADLQVDEHIEIGGHREARLTGTGSILTHR